MKKVSFQIKCDIVSAYLDGEKYNKIQKGFGVNRWNIQDALSKFNIKTNRIKSPPRLLGNEKRRVPTPIEHHHDMDFLPPIKPKENNPVLDDDLDYQERYDLDGIDNYIPKNQQCEIVITEDNEIKYSNKE